MAVLSRLAADVGSLSRKVTSALLWFLFPSWYDADRKYWPEQHYMRGPGPEMAREAPLKWRVVPEGLNLYWLSRHGTTHFGAKAAPAMSD